MPTTRRRQRNQRPGLTPAQYEDLVFGYRMFSPQDEPGFASEADEKLAWERNRARLMAEHEPGRRPWGYLHFDLGEQLIPGWWFRELEILERHGVIDRAEEILIERNYPDLDPKQDATFHETADPHLSGPTLAHCRDTCRFVAGWHARRNRPELAEKYERWAAAQQRWIDELKAD